MPPLLSAPKITEPKWWAVIVSATVPATSLSGSPTRNSWPIRCASVIEASTVAGQEAVGDGEGDAFGAAAVAEWVTDTDADEDAGCDGSPDAPPHPATTPSARTPAAAPSGRHDSRRANGRWPGIPIDIHPPAVERLTPRVYAASASGR